MIVGFLVGHLFTGQRRIDIRLSLCCMVALFFLRIIFRSLHLPTGPVVVSCGIRSSRLTWNLNDVRKRQTVQWIPNSLVCVGLWRWHEKCLKKREHVTFECGVQYGRLRMGATRNRVAGSPTARGLSAWGAKEGCPSRMPSGCTKH